jgi:hypothetical protein
MQQCQPLRQQSTATPLHSTALSCSAAPHLTPPNGPPIPTHPPHPSLTSGLTR